MATQVLVLHGYHENAFRTYRKLAPIIAECGDRVQFYFLDAPMLLIPADPKANWGDASDERCILKPVPTCSTPTMRPKKSEAHRAWFKINDVGRDSLPGIEQTWVYLREVLKQHRFDAIFGFSQGGAMAEQISAMLERPNLFPMFCENGIPPHPPLKFIACVSGFLIRGPKLSWESTDSSDKTVLASPEFGFTMNTPALFVVGLNDIIVPPERSHLFVQHSKYHRVEEHLGGHFIPMKTRWRQFFVSFFLNPFAEIPSPTLSAPTFDDEEMDVIVSSPNPSNSYQTGQTLHNPHHEQNQPEEDHYLFCVVYDSSSDHELPSSSFSSPPDTPFLRTPELPVLEIDEPSIVNQPHKYGFDAVEDLYPASARPSHAAAEAMKSKL
ncbi:serine hydrolase-domain-containing protein [Lentinula raphanica]|uniref:Serine hydrolase-domain-containing protein n=1 Tax=Lentinula raphanica TaxID=153919 RepID=A0AA38U8M2_9AGAR|nr:serine hydrolase-domain-containing protein [Lentinula raphanica]KAJ3776185.1 serine hydrolase-domain-containing protein [Lentinula raphanica]KAJ3834374.1 serine hydrolase-domain-containing protein [Lentinula raphanica]